MHISFAESHVCFRLSDNLVVKVSDFGLAEHIGDNGYYKERNQIQAMPVRWMSIEAIEHRLFTFQSDVVCILVQ